MSDTTEDRLERLEENMAHGEMTISQLSDEVARQGNVIDRLNRIIVELEEKIELLEVDPREAPPANQPPPHY